MPTHTANSIRAEPTSYGQRIKLPDRDVGEASVFGWVLIVFGSVGVLFMLAWISGPASEGIKMVLKGQWFGCLLIAFGMLGLGGLFVAIKIIAGGLAVVRNRVGCEIRITNKHLISREKFGWFSHSFKVEQKKIESLFLRPMLIDEQDDQGDSLPPDWIAKRLPDNCYAIATKARKGTLIAAGYPAKTLLSAANIVKDELDRNRVGLVSVVEHTENLVSLGKSQTIQQPISIVQQSAEEIAAVPVELPADSSLEIVDQGDATVYRLPEKGIWKGSFGLMFFAMIWNGFMALVSFVLLFGNGKLEGELWVMVLMMVLFWAVGIGLLVGAIYLGRRSALIGVKEGLLFIERKSIFGTKWTDFEPGKVASIHVGPGTMEVNDKPVMELKIEPVGQETIGLLSQLEDDELHWLAQQLTSELDLKPYSPGSWQRYLDPDQPLTKPETSKVTVEQAGDQMVIVIPTQTIEGHWMLMVMGLAMALGSIPAAIVAILNFDSSWILIPIALVGTLMGVGMWVADRLYTSRWFRLAVDESQITIERHGFLSERVGSISKENIKGVVLKDSGAKVNNRTYMHLAITSSKSSESFTLMSGRDEREIAYVAGLIHRTLRLDETSPGT